MRTLLLTAAGTLALSTAALAVDAGYTVDGNGIYTFTGSGTSPINLHYNHAVEGVTLNADVRLDVDGGFVLAENMNYALTLNTGSALIATGDVKLKYSSGVIVQGNSEIKSSSSSFGPVSFYEGFLTLNANLSVAATGDYAGIDLQSADISMNLDNSDSETSFLTLDVYNVSADSSTSFNLKFTGVLTGDYKLVTLGDAVDSKYLVENTIHESNFKLNNTPMTEAQKENLRWDNNTLVYSAGAIPEPSLFGVLAGLGALALAGTRRRRK